MISDVRLRLRPSTLLITLYQNIITRFYMLYDRRVLATFSETIGIFYC